MKTNSDALPFTYAKDPTVAPPARFMTLTIVGSGVSTGIPVLGHIGRPCACADATANPNGKNNRNNVSLLITVRSSDAATDAAQQLEINKLQEEANQNAQKKDKQVAHQSHDTFNTVSYNTLLDSANHSDDIKPVVLVKHTLIDCGKTFRDAYFKVLIKSQVQLVDALLLTHDHADAVSGLDDLRDLQRMHMGSVDLGEDASEDERMGKEVKGHWYIDHYINTFLSKTTFDSLSKSVRYIVNNSQILGSALKCESEFFAGLKKYEEKFLKNADDENENEQLKEKKRTQQLTSANDIGIRRSTALRFFTVNDLEPQKFYCPSLGSNVPVYSVPVEHGKNYISLGFVFGTGVQFASTEGATTSAADHHPSNGSCVVYLSDISAISELSLSFLKSLVKIDVLIIDMLHLNGRNNPVHFCMDDVVDFIVDIRPKTAFTMGMHCDVEHEEGRQILWKKIKEKIENIAKNGVEMENREILLADLCYDGMQLNLPL